MFSCSAVNWFAFPYHILPTSSPVKRQQCTVDSVTPVFSSYFACPEEGVCALEKQPKQSSVENSDNIIRPIIFSADSDGNSNNKCKAI